MKKLGLSFLAALAGALTAILVLASGSSLLGQNTGELLPPIYPVFTAANGTTPLALGFICTTATGTSTNLATYSEPTNTTANANPILLNSTGRAVSGATLIRIYLGAASYRITLYAAGTGNTCNGTTVGTQIYQEDGVYNLGQLMTLSFATKLDDMVCHASQYTGTTPNNLGGKITACLAVLPSTGGTIDARGLEGAQAMTATVTLSKPVTVILPAGTISASSAAPFTCNTSGVTVMGVGATATILSLATGIDGINPCTGMTLKDFTIRGPDIQASANGCIDGGSSHEVTVENMVLELCAGPAINTGGDSDGWIITKNRIRRNRLQGIFLGQGSDNAIVIENSVEDNYGIGIDNNGSGTLIDDNEIHRNGVTNSGTDEFGVLAAAVTGNISGVIISNNRISGGYGPAVMVTAASTYTSSHIQITDNVISGQTTANGDGITVGDGAAPGSYSNITIKHNLVYSNSRFCIFLDGTAVAALAETTVSDNDCIDNTNTGLYESAGVTGSRWINNRSLGNGTAKTLSGTTPVDVGNQTTVTEISYPVVSKLLLGAQTGASSQLDVVVAAATPPTDGIRLSDGTTGWIHTYNAANTYALRTVAADAIVNNDKFALDVNGNATILGGLNTGDLATFADMDATPSVLASDFFYVDNSGATAITQFDDCANGKTFSLVFANGNTDLTNGATLVLLGAANWTASDALDTITFRCGAGNTAYELGRSVN